MPQEWPQKRQKDQKKKMRKSILGRRKNMSVYIWKAQGIRKISVKSSSVFLITNDNVFQNERARGTRIIAPTISPVKKIYYSSSCPVTVETNMTSIHEDAGSIPSLT